MSIDVRPLREQDLKEADRIFRLAFGTFLGLPDPTAFAPGVDLIATRWRAPACNAAMGAFDGETLVGSNCVARWGSFGFFGPLTVRPDYWGKGIAQHLLEPTMDAFARWGTRQAGLFTFPQSPMHLALYQKYDFWPQQLTPVMGKPIGAANALPVAPGFDGSRDDLVAQARALTESVFPGLDLSGELEAVLDQNLGEIVTVPEAGRLAAFAVCHVGSGTEAGEQSAYVKFAAARTGAGRELDRLLAACEGMAARRGMSSLAAGVNTFCHDAYQGLLRRVYRTQLVGIAMQQKNGKGYLAPDALVLGDWR